MDFFFSKALISCFWMSSKLNTVCNKLAHKAINSNFQIFKFPCETFKSFHKKYVSSYVKFSKFEEQFKLLYKPGMGLNSPNEHIYFWIFFNLLHVSARPFDAGSTEEVTVHVLIDALNLNILLKV